MVRLMCGWPVPGWHMRNRAQLLLVGALLLAMTFVGIALLLNTVLFSENLATRSQGDAGSAETYRAAVVETVSGALVRVNHQNNTSQQALRQNLSSTVATWAEQSRRFQVPKGATANGSVVDTTAGTFLLQTNRSRNFTAGGTGAAAGDTDWTLATDTETRRARLNVSRGSLHAVGTDGTLSDSTLDGVTGAAFHALVDDGTTHRVYVFVDSSDTVRVFVEGPTGDYLGENDPSCQAADERVTVDLQRGTVAGQDCDALSFYGATGTHDLRFRNATEVEGTYEFLVNGSVDTSPYFDADSGRSPFTTPAIYAATLRVTYQNAERDYSADTRVTPAA